MASVLALTRCSARTLMANQCSQIFCAHIMTPCRLWSTFSRSTYTTTKQHVLTSLPRFLSRWPALQMGAARRFSAKGSRLQCVGRGGKLPFEVDARVANDTLLYTHSNAYFFRCLSFFGVVQLVFWGQLAVFSWTSLSTIDTAEAGNLGIDKGSFWGKIVVMQTEYKKTLSAMCVSIGAVILFLTMLYPRRSIQQLMLLRGGKDLQVSTYTNFGRTRHFTIPVTGLSVHAARASKAAQISLKIKDHRFFYLMDKKDGQFHETRLFDYAIGIKRTF